jgi:hypothetical protein
MKFFKVDFVKLFDIGELINLKQL